MEEEAIYDQILAIYSERLGLSFTDDPTIYKKLIDVVSLLKEQRKNQDPENMQEIVTNAIVLILSLFFNKKDKDFDDFDEQTELTPQDRKNIKQILGNTWNIISSNA